MSESGAHIFNIRSTIKVLLILIAAIWVLSGIFVVNADEAAVIRILGRVQPGVLEPGIHYHFPYPISSATTLKAREVKTLNIGFEQQKEQTTEEKQELFYFFSDWRSEFLTGDENIIHGKVTVQWSIADPVAYLTAVQEPMRLLEDIAREYMMRELGAMEVDEALTNKKLAIVTNLRSHLQQRLNEIGTGIVVVVVTMNELGPPKTVAASFKDVASAKGDANRMIHEAEGDQNERLPAARGQAQQLRTEAASYKERVINQAQGDAARFDLLYQEYKKNPSVTRQRLYLEAMEEVMPRVKKYTLSSDTATDTTRVTIFLNE